ncbi:response regulator [Candidatus Uabimicrobium sp. HlEnr_7]|uniref:response regulator n=1 Tax=Candidatus Uabimicrobium helgolandensis TaxID=3095367 RepID=UPI003558C3C8
MLKKVHKTPKKILLVDHEDPIREILRSVLEGAGYIVVTARNREEALKKIDKKLPDIIISEAELPPVKSGFHFYKHLKAEAKTASIPFIFLTAVEEKIVSKLLKAQDGYINKPVKSQDFLEKVDTFIGKRIQKAAPEVKKTRRTKVKQEKSVIKVLDFNIDKLPKPARSKNINHPIMPLPPGHSTKFFSNPSGAFDLKMLKTAMVKAARGFKSGVVDYDNMLFPRVEETAVRKRLVPVKMPEKLEPVPVDNDMMVVDLELTEDGVFQEDHLLQELNEDILEAEDRTENNLRSVFLQHFANKSPDFQTGIFDDLVVLDNKYSILYSDKEIDNISQVRETWEEFLHNLRSLSIRSELKGNTSYLWMETEDENFLLVNSPQKEILPFASVSDAPMEAIFADGEQQSRESIPDTTFFLLPNLNCTMPIITRSKVCGMIAKLVSGFNIEDKVNAVVQNKNSGQLIATTEEQENCEQVFQCAHDLFSVAGLCNQVCEIGFNTNYVLIETEDQNLLFVNDENKDLFISCLDTRIVVPGLKNHEGQQQLK